MESAAVGSSGFGASSRCKPGEVAWLVPDPDSSWRRISYWFDNLPGPVTPRQPLPGNLEADVVIVGAGYTGMWTAYYLSAIDPGLRVAVLEREVAGYGASGRNGGWCSAFFAVSPESLTKSYGLDAMGAMQRAMQHSVDEVGAAAAAEGGPGAAAGGRTLWRDPPRIFDRLPVAGEGAARPEAADAEI